MATLTDSQIRETCELVHAAVLDARNNGKLRTFIGLHGHVTLLHDRLQRWFEEKDEGRKLDELMGLAVDALVAFAIATPEVKIDMEAVFKAAETENQHRRTAVKVATHEAAEVQEERELQVRHPRSDVPRTADR